MDRHVLAHSLHDLGLAGWFGGSLMGAVGLNGAASALDDPTERSAVATKGWNRWTPVSALAIGAHLVGAVQLLRTEQHRVAHQDGVFASSAVKTGVTAAALGATAWSGVLNRKMAAAGPVPVAGATEPGPQTPADVAKAQKQLKAVQWLIPGLTAGLLATKTWQEEQMRPAQVAAGLLPSAAGRAAPLAAVTAAALGAAALARSRKNKDEDARPAPAPEPMPVPVDMVVVDEVVVDPLPPADLDATTGVERGPIV